MNIFHLFLKIKGKDYFIHPSKKKLRVIKTLFFQTRLGIKCNVYYEYLGQESLATGYAHCGKYGMNTEFLQRLAEAKAHRKMHEKCERTAYKVHRELWKLSEEIKREYQTQDKNAWNESDYINKYINRWTKTINLP